MDNNEKTIFTWTEDGKATAEEIGQKYEKKGMPITYHGKAVENQLHEIGKSYEASHLLHFLGDEEILLISFKDEMGGYSVYVQVKDLIFS